VKRRVSDEVIRQTSCRREGNLLAESLCDLASGYHAAIENSSVLLVVIDSSDLRDAMTCV